MPDCVEKRVGPDAKLDALGLAVERLTRDFGGWQVPWGEINRIHRLDDAIAPHFSDADASIPVPFTCAQWGSLALFGAKPWPGTRRYYLAVGVRRAFPGAAIGRMT